ncbi:hypothetical protein C8R47DRAFT_1074250 [Mycena vitilis]|nr:hypothetical protein C8R47DRAFT_1074250 [Mycena vitilis]
MILRLTRPHPNLDASDFARGEIFKDLQRSRKMQKQQGKSEENARPATHHAHQGRIVSSMMTIRQIGPQRHSSASGISGKLQLFFLSDASFRPGTDLSYLFGARTKVLEKSTVQDKLCASDADSWDQLYIGARWDELLHRNSSCAGSMNDSALWDLHPTQGEENGPFVTTTVVGQPTAEFTHSLVDVRSQQLDGTVRKAHLGPSVYQGQLSLAVQNEHSLEVTRNFLQPGASFLSSWQELLTGKDNWTICDIQKSRGSNLPERRGSRPLPVPLSMTVETPSPLLIVCSPLTRIQSERQVLHYNIGTPIRRTNIPVAEKIPGIKLLGEGSLYGIGDLGDVQPWFTQRESGTVAVQCLQKALQLSVQGHTYRKRMTVNLKRLLPSKVAPGAPKLLIAVTFTLNVMGNKTEPSTLVRHRQKILLKKHTVNVTATEPDFDSVQVRSTFKIGSERDRGNTNYVLGDLGCSVLVHGLQRSLWFGRAKVLRLQNAGDRQLETS